MSKKVDEKAKKPAKEEAPSPPEAPKEEVVPEKLVKAPKPQKKRKEEKNIFTLYKIEGDKAVRLRPVCERCGQGYFMGDHGNRYTCGHCGFTRYKPAQT